jgi:hypothetical protein
MMPSLKNLARIKDTATGKYLQACGAARYSWRRKDYFYDVYQRRNNSWSFVGTAYKKVHIKTALEAAALSLAWSKAHKEKRIPKELDERPKDAGTNEKGYEVWREARQEFAQQILAEAEIPETWVVEEFIVMSGCGAETPAREWNG